MNFSIEPVIAHYQAGRLVEAEVACRQILAAQPVHADAQRWLGVIALASGRFAEAVELISKAIALAPARADFHSDLGAAFRLLGRLEEAVACFRRAAELQPDLPDAHLNLGEALTELGRFEEAIPSCRRGLALNPGYATAHNNLGNALAQAGQRDEAFACFQRALALDPACAEAHNNLGTLFTQMERWDDVIACSRRAIAARPDFAAAHASIGLAFTRKGLFHEAVASYRRALALRDELVIVHWNLALLLLLLGQWEEGWREHEWRLRCPSLLSTRYASPETRWDGSAAVGKTLLIHSEQGVGDTIHFMRYVPLVRERANAARVIVECQPSLARLLAQSGGWHAEIVAQDARADTTPPAHDLHLPMHSLPLVLGKFAPLPMAEPYLQADAGLRAQWRKRLHPGFRVGIAWAGSAAHKDDRSRSIAPVLLAPLLAVPGVSFYSLQVGQAAEAGMLDPAGQLADFADTAALLAELDLVISVDTAVAHLAGALGRSVWLLLPFVPDWRWGTAGETTTWYPALRLFRQCAPGGWSEVIARVAAALTAERMRRQVAE